jgi:hypothetical protein
MKQYKSVVWSVYLHIRVARCPGDVSPPLSAVQAAGGTGRLPVVRQLRHRPVQRLCRAARHPAVSFRCDQARLSWTLSMMLRSFAHGLALLVLAPRLALCSCSTLFITGFGRPRGLQCGGADSIPGAAEHGAPQHGTPRPAGHQHRARQLQLLPAVSLPTLNRFEYPNEPVD